jgi:NADH:ubiquinone oxidoreductase subunit K
VRPVPYSDCLYTWSYRQSSLFVTNSTERFLTTQSLIFLAITDTVKLSNDLLYSIVLIIQTFNQQVGKKVFLILYRYCHYINTVSTLNTAWLTLSIAIER